MTKSKEQLVYDFIENHRHAYISFEDDVVLLDGRFTVEDLEKISELLRGNDNDAN